jgi:hypothetical protein
MRKAGQPLLEQLERIALGHLAEDRHRVPATTAAWRAQTIYINQMNGLAKAGGKPFELARGVCRQGC